MPGQNLHNRLAFQRIAIRADNFPRHLRRRRWDLPVILRLKELEQFRPAFLLPCLGIGYGLAVECLEHIRQREVADLGLGVVDGDTRDDCIRRIRYLGGPGNKERPPRKMRCRLKCT